jgi:hypothetical protein
MPQKLITVYMTEQSEGDRGIQELLGDYLDEGWQVVSVTPLGVSGGGAEGLRTWFVVVLEQLEAAEE